MIALMQLKFRAGATAEENKAASRKLQEGLETPSPGLKVVNSWVDLGAGVVYTILDITEGVAPRNEVLKRFLEFRVLPAVDSWTFTPLVETKEALGIYLKM